MSRRNYKIGRIVHKKQSSVLKVHRELFVGGGSLGPQWKQTSLSLGTLALVAEGDWMEAVKEKELVCWEKWLVWGGASCRKEGVLKTQKDGACERASSGPGWNNLTAKQTM